MIQSLIVTLREGLEAALIVSILLAYLATTLTFFLRTPRAEPAGAPVGG